MNAPPDNPGARVRAEDEARSRLESWLGSEADQPVNADVEVLKKALLRRRGVAAVLFYGSGLWGDAGADTLYDFYVLVDRYQDWAPGRALAAGGNVVPPNVYLVEEPHGASVLRCKVAVMRLIQFRKGAEGRSFTPQIWARFCQPCRVLYTRDAGVRAQVIAALASAVRTFHERTLPLVETLDVPSFWEAGLKSTYATEVRSEKASRAAKLVDASRASLTERTRLVLPLCRPKAWLTPSGVIASELSPRAKRWRRMCRALKRPLQKTVPVARLIKAAFTFRGGLDYLRWKIEKHSGVHIPPSEFQRRHPVIAGLLLLWHVRRKGGIR